MYLAYIVVGIILSSLIYKLLRRVIKTIKEKKELDKLFIKT